eukprot:6492412-Amphidinium_carterae.3
MGFLCPCSNGVTASAPPSLASIGTSWFTVTAPATHPSVRHEASNAALPSYRLPPAKKLTPGKFAVGPAETNRAW